MIIKAQAVAVIRMTLLKAGLILISHCLIKVHSGRLRLVRCGFHAHSVMLLSVSLVTPEPGMNWGEFRQAGGAANLLDGTSGVRLVGPGVVALLWVPARDDLANGWRRMRRRTLIELMRVGLTPEMIHGWERARVVEKGPLRRVRTHQERSFDECGTSLFLGSDDSHLSVLALAFGCSSGNVLYRPGCCSDNLGGVGRRIHSRHRRLKLEWLSHEAAIGRRGEQGAPHLRWRGQLLLHLALS